MYTNYKISKALHILGYTGIECHAFYTKSMKLYESLNHDETCLLHDVDKEFSAPTHEEVLNFFEKEYHIKITAQHQTITGMWFCWIWEYKHIETDKKDWVRLTYIVNSFQFKTDAYNAAIEFLIKEYFKISL
jgi:hypothetical protein